MNYNQFKNLSCYEEFEIRCNLIGVSKIDVLKEIGYKVDDYYFFVSNDGIFNQFDLNGNHIEDPRILKEIVWYYIPINITNCIITNSVTRINASAFDFCESLKEIIIPDSVTYVGSNVFFGCTSLKEVIFKGKTLKQVKQMDNYPFGIEDESIIKCEI